MFYNLQTTRSSHGLLMWVYQVLNLLMIRCDEGLTSELDERKGLTQSSSPVKTLSKASLTIVVQAMIKSKQSSLQGAIHLITQNVLPSLYDTMHPDIEADTQRSHGVHQRKKASLFTEPIDQLKTQLNARRRRLTSHWTLTDCTLCSTYRSCSTTWSRLFFFQLRRPGPVYSWLRVHCGDSDLVKRITLSLAISLFIFLLPSYTRRVETRRFIMPWLRSSSSC